MICNSIYITLSSVIKCLVSIIIHRRQFDNSWKIYFVNVLIFKRINGFRYKRIDCHFTENNIFTLYNRFCCYNSSWIHLLLIKTFDFFSK